MPHNHETVGLSVPPDSRFDDWIGLLSSRELILHLGSGEQGGYPISTKGRVIRIDIQSRFRPDIAGDAQQLPFSDKAFDGVLAMSILEHVPQPWVAVAEIHRVLRPKGLVVGYVPYMFPYHANETFHDYFRFSDDALESLLGSFSLVRVMKTGGYANTLLRFAAGFTASERHLVRIERPFAAFLAGIARHTGLGESTRIRGLLRSPTGYHFMAVK